MINKVKKPTPFLIGIVATGLLGTAATAYLAVRAGTPGSLEGVWRSDGYGLIVEIRRNTMRLSEVTQISCIPSATAHKLLQTPLGAEAAFLSRPNAMLGPRTLVIKPGASSDIKRLNQMGTASDIVLQRIARKPSLCDVAVTNDPQTNFNVFWQTFAEHYPLFAMKKVNWSAVRQEYVERVTPKIAPEKLFEVFRSMSEPLQDAHTAIYAENIGKEFLGERLDSNPVSEQRVKRVKMVLAKHLVTPLRSWAKGQVSYGLLTPSIGYLQITSLAGYTDSDVFMDDLKELETALDSIFTKSGQLQGLVIDVRVNGGGSDMLGIEIASRLTSKPYLAYSKVARNDPNDPSQFTKPQPSIVKPSAKPGFLGPVVLLTSRYSVSAAETFTQALMGRQPSVTRVGENTQGVFSDVLSRRLPNGWFFGLPNELFLTENGKFFDVTGIPPNIVVPVFESKDLSAGRDPALKKALQILTAHPKQNIKGIR